MKHKMKLALALLLAVLLALPTFVLAENDGTAPEVADMAEAIEVMEAEANVFEEADADEEPVDVTEAELLEEEVLDEAGDAPFDEGAVSGDVQAEADAAGTEELTVDLSEAIGDLTEAPAEDVVIPEDDFPADGEVIDADEGEVGDEPDVDADAQDEADDAPSVDADTDPEGEAGASPEGEAGEPAEGEAGELTEGETGEPIDATPEGEADAIPEGDESEGGEDGEFEGEKAAAPGGETEGEGDEPAQAEASEADDEAVPESDSEAEPEADDESESEAEDGAESESDGDTEPEADDTPETPAAVRVTFAGEPETADVSVRLIRLAEAQANEPAEGDPAGEAQADEPAEGDPAAEVQASEPAEGDPAGEDEPGEPTDGGPAGAAQADVILAEADGTFLLLPGEYAYSASAEGYSPLADVPFTVPGDAETLVVPFALEPTLAAGAAPKAERRRKGPNDEERKVSYLDLKGKTDYENCTIYDEHGILGASDEITWYAVDGTFVIDSLDISGDVNLILCDGGSLTVSKGINVSLGNSLTLWAQSDENNMGVLYAGTNVRGEKTCGAGCVGIGGWPSSNDYCGKIVINGGNIHARGSDSNGNDSATAAIGGSADSSGKGCEITINCGVIEAIGGDFAAGIGGSSYERAGTITINGGTVIAKSEKGMAIGTTLLNASNDIVINGGSVDATSTNGDAISTVYGTVRINDCNVKATSSSGNAISAKSGTVEINGGQVEAKSTSGEGILANRIQLTWERDSEGNAPDKPRITAKSYKAENGVHLLNAFKQVGGSEKFYADEGPDCSKLAQKPIVPVGIYNVDTKVAEGRGTIRVSHSHAEKNDTITVEVQAEDKYELSELTYTARSGGSPVSIGQTNGAFTFSMPADHVTVAVKFTRLETKYYDPNTDQSIDCPATSVMIRDMADRTKWTEGWYIASGECNIDERVTVTGNVNLVLLNDAVLNAKSGITVEGANSLTVWAETKDGNGQLIANAEKFKDYAAGIGGSADNSGGTITFYGGVIKAIGANYAAGIGGGIRGSGGNITISGYTVVQLAEGGYAPSPTTGYLPIHHGPLTPGIDDLVDHATALGGGAGIGGGARADGGTIVISGNAKVNAEGTLATSIVGGAGIGGGNNSGGGSITISGGEVTATGGQNAAGIGGGENGPGGTITISGGKVYATGGGEYSTYNCGGAGIGGGRYQNGGKITISGKDTEVKAYASNLAAAIGGGREGDGGEITILDGKVMAYGSSNVAYSYGAGIGGGYGSDGGKITIEGGVVSASGGSANNEPSASESFGGGAGIGGGSGAGCGEIVIKGGKITADGGNTSAGIGCGGYLKKAGLGGTITIVDGEIEAHGALYGAGIGGGYRKDCDSITISGGTITEAKGVAGGAGIGGAYDGSCGSITISGGTVNARSADSSVAFSMPVSPAIGDGVSGGGSKITLTWNETEGSGIPGLPAIYADSYAGTVTLVKPFQDKDQPLDKFLGDQSDLSALGGKTLVPTEGGIRVNVDPDIIHGTVSARPNLAEEGNKVTLTVLPDLSYVLTDGSLRVTQGNVPVTITQVDESTWTFDMPGEEVTVTAAFEQIPLKYLDPTDDAEPVKTCAAYSALTSRDRNWPAGWYAVMGNVTINAPIAVTGGVNLILCDGASLTAPGGIQLQASDDATCLTIWAQSKGSDVGRLVIETAAPAIDGSIAEDSDVIIHGGSITATSTEGSALLAKRNLVIDSGTVNATGRSGIVCLNGELTIAGGTVTATGNGDTEKGIYTGSGRLSISGESTHVIVTGSGDGIDAEADVVVTGGTLEVNGGYRGIFANAGLSISGEKTSVTAKSTGSFGIQISKDLTITGGALEATGSSNGIKTDGVMEVSGAGTRVTATGSSSYDIHADSGLTITGGTVEATGSAHGIFAPSGSGVKIGGADTVVTSTGDLSAGNSAVEIGGGVTIVTGLIEAGSGITLTWSGATYAGMSVTATGGYRVGNGTMKLAQPFQYTGSEGATVNLPRTDDADVSALAGVTLVPCDGWSVNIAGGIEHGALASDADFAVQGDPVTLTATPESGWVLKSVTVTDTDGKPVQVDKDLTFTMPGSDVTATAEFWTPTGVTVAPTTAKLLVGKGMTLAASVAPEGFPQTVTWTSSDTKVAVVDATGKVTAKGAGSATITATTVNGLRAKCSVRVHTAPTGVKVKPKKKTLKKGKTVKLKATVKGKNADPTLTWTSSNKKVAKVNNKGVVTALKPGKATITVKTVNGKKAKCVITVTSSAAGMIKFD